MGRKMSGFREFNSVPGPAYPLGILSKRFYELSINDKSSNKLSETFYYIYIYYKNYYYYYGGWFSLDLPLSTR